MLLFHFCLKFECESLDCPDGISKYAIILFIMCVLLLSFEKCECYPHLVSFHSSVLSIVCHRFLFDIIIYNGSWSRLCILLWLFRAYAMCLSRKRRKRILFQFYFLSLFVCIQNSNARIENIVHQFFQWNLNSASFASLIFIMRTRFNKWKIWCNLRVCPRPGHATVIFLLTKYPWTR